MNDRDPDRTEAVREIATVLATHTCGFDSQSRYRQ
jgi:hypothetical protein